MSHRVAVLTPIYRRRLDEDEVFSLESMRRWLGGYDHYAVVPEFLAGGCPGDFTVDRVKSFPNAYFGSPKDYNWLLLSSDFYRRFEDYEYLLIAQLDSLVLRDGLEEWCAKGYDYVGAPWAERYETGGGVEFQFVGNGGFSLRRTEAALRVLGMRVSQHPDYTIGPKPTWWYWRRVRGVVLSLGRVRGLLPRITVERFLRRHFLTNEDVFWGRYASMLDKHFSVACVEEALRFAFEADPAGSFRRMGNELPFGCHAWARYDRAFWDGMLRV